uniref:restriction endonuclease subunit S n=1 Tax=Prevotella sp. TaxID=59823 RepID=UPI0040281CEB
MKNLETLILELCPDGVEFVKLGDCCSFKRGKTITAKNAIPGDVPVLAGGQKPAYYHNEANRTGETIVVAGSGAYAGFVSYWTVPVFLSDSFSVEPDDRLVVKFVYYFLKNIQQKIFATKKGSGVPHVHGSSIEKFEIPLPPIEVQTEIVRILDKFTSLEAELEAELDCRKRQYEYYRDKLLSFDNVGGQEVEWMKMNEVFDMRNGYTPSKAKAEYWEGGTIPWFRMEDIRENGRILSDSIQHITMEGVKKGNLFPANSFILATTATIGEHALLIADSLANQRFTNLTVCKSLSDRLLVKFVFHYMFIVDEWCKKNINVSGFASVDMNKFKKLEFPIPSLEEQHRIVSILDRFESLTTSLQSGLPAEIAARRQQYEHYRDKLLTFKRKGAA